MNAYELDNEALLKEFMNACGRAGTSNSGLCYDLAASEHLKYAHYLKGVVLAKIEGEDPPFKPGDIVICVKRDGAYPAFGYSSFPLPGTILCQRQPKKIIRVYYKGGKKWEVELAPNHERLYRAEDFSIAETPNDTPERTTKKQPTTTASLAEWGDGLGRTCQKHGMIWCKKIECQ